jgi:hypothetical protein
VTHRFASYSVKKIPVPSRVIEDVWDTLKTRDQFTMRTVITLFNIHGPVKVSDDPFHMDRVADRFLQRFRKLGLIETINNRSWKVS